MSPVLTLPLLFLASLLHLQCLLSTIISGLFHTHTTPVPAFHFLVTCLLRFPTVMPASQPLPPSQWWRELATIGNQAIPNMAKMEKAGTERKVQDRMTMKEKWEGRGVCAAFPFSSDECCGCIVVSYFGYHSSPKFPPPKKKTNPEALPPNNTCFCF